MFAQAYTMQFKAVTCFPSVVSGLHQVGKFLNYRWSALISILDIVTHSYMCFTTSFFLVPSNTSFVVPRRKKVKNHRHSVF